MLPASPLQRRNQRHRFKRKFPLEVKGPDRSPPAQLWLQTSVSNHAKSCQQANPGLQVQRFTALLFPALYMGISLRYP